MLADKQAEVYVKAVENFMEEMELTESIRYDRPAYRTDKEEDGGADKRMTL